MSPLSIVFLAFSMSVDSYLASMGIGAGHRRLHWPTVLRTGLLFAVVQMIMPLIGWYGGHVASSFVEPIDHWIAFGLLALVGGRMALLALFGDKDDDAPVSGGIMPLMLTAIGTSIDALVVGVSLAFLDVNIVSVTAAIGGATFLMSVGGLLAGRVLKCRLGCHAEVVAGLVLIGLGFAILLEHLAA
jgi:putative Mn2+ efflux pump MntP